MADIQSKYQKLATEYAKLRAQVPVLKKAVLDEQAKEVELEEIVKEKDQCMRKLEQEVDSLSFRNQQLTTRVELLQKESEKANVKGKKTKKNNDVTAVDSVTAASAVLSEELQSKIAENASLHTRLSDTEVRHSAAISELQRQISQLEFKAGQHESDLDECVAKNKQQLDKLQDDKIQLTVKLQKRDSEYRDATLKAQALEEKLAKVEEQLTQELAEAKRIIEEKLQFNYSEQQSLNGAQVTVAFDPEQQSRCKALVTQAGSLLKDFVQALMNFYTYSEQRSRVYPVDADQEALSPVNKQYCQYLHENAMYIRPIEKSFNAFSDSVKEDAMTALETAVELEQFARSFDKLCNYVSKILPYQLLSLEEESSAPVCSQQLRSSNQQLAAAFKQWQAAFARLNTYVCLLAFQSSDKCDHPNTSQAHLLELTSRAAAHMHQTLLVVSKCYQKKLTLEHELPTVCNQLKITNECALSSLLNLVSVHNQMSTFFSSNLEVFSKSIQSHPVNSVLMKHATDYIASLQRNYPEPVPTEAELHDGKTSSSTESSDSLARQVESLQEHVARLEQEKEHWMLETKLLQRKYEKECQKSSAAEKRIDMIQAELSGQSLNDSLMPGLVGPTAKSNTKHNDEAPASNGLESLLGKLTRSLSEDGDVTTREEFIKDYYGRKIGTMTKQIQLADSKAIHLHAECRALSKQLKCSLEERDRLQTNLGAATQTAAQLKDELQTTSRSYEDQLKTMTEHLTGMNDRLTSQADEIDALKHRIAAGGKTTKKGFLSKQGK